MTFPVMSPLGKEKMLRVSVSYSGSSWMDSSSPSAASINPVERDEKLEMRNPGSIVRVKPLADSLKPGS